MKIHNMGHITHPLLICGGAYGNLEALYALDEFAESLEIPSHRIIHTGDAIAYCADARAAAEHVARRGYQAIFGNVEEQLAEEALDCACGFEEGSACDVLARSWYAHAQSQMVPELVQWMAELPAFLSFTMSGKSVQVVHGAPSQTNKFMWESLPANEFAGEFETSGADIIIAGHTGIPFTRTLADGRIWHNSGALGMPANDGTPRVWVSLMNPTDHGPELTHVPLEYDHAAAVKKMRVQHLPEGYANALETGLWPSQDILPETERQNTGVRRAA